MMTVLQESLPKSSPRGLERAKGGLQFKLRVIQISGKLLQISFFPFFFCELSLFLFGRKPHSRLGRRTSLRGGGN